MKNFTYAIPTVIHFGKGQIEKLGAEIAQRSRKVRRSEVRFRR